MNGALEYCPGGGKHPEVVEMDENDEEKEKEKEKKGGKKVRRSSDVSCSWRRPSATSDSAQFWESSKGSGDATDREVTTRDNGEGGQNDRDTHHAHSVWQTFKKVGVEFNQDARKMFRYVGRKLRSGHGARETKVKEIYIVPGEDNEGKWARRLAGSSHRRSSSSF